MSFSRRNWSDLSRWVRAARMGSGWAAGTAGCGEDRGCHRVLVLPHQFLVLGGFLVGR